MLHHFTGVTIQVANLVNYMYNCHSLKDGIKRIISKAHIPSYIPRAILFRAKFFYMTWPGSHLGHVTWAI